MDLYYSNEIFLLNSSFSEIHWQREFYFYAKLCSPDSLIAVPEFSINSSALNHKIDFMVICKKYKIEWAFELCMADFEEHLKRFFHNGTYSNLIIKDCSCNLIYLNNIRGFNLNTQLNKFLDEMISNSGKLLFLEKFKENFTIFQINYDLVSNFLEIKKFHLKLKDKKYFFDFFFIFQRNKY